MMDPPRTGQVSPLDLAKSLLKRGAAVDARTLGAGYRTRFNRLDHGVDVSLKDANGETALHGAAYRGHNDVVQYLVRGILQTAP